MHDGRRQKSQPDPDRHPDFPGRKSGPLAETRPPLAPAECQERTDVCGTRPVRLDFSLSAFCKKEGKNGGGEPEQETPRQGLRCRAGTFSNIPPLRNEGPDHQKEQDRRDDADLGASEGDEGLWGDLQPVADADVSHRVPDGNPVMLRVPEDDGTENEQGDQKRNMTG